MAGASLLPLFGCGGTTDDDPGDGSSTCSKIPEETAGPYPGDGSNGANALMLAGIVRSDIRSSIAGASGVAAGVPLKVTLTLVNSNNECSPLAGYAIYLWHCDRAGLYSMYSAGVTGENYLRGVQETDSNGQVTFTTIFPGCYSGRWPHIHFEMYPSIGVATASNQKVATSQLALPEASCTEAYAATGYSSSVNNLKQITLASDNVFRDSSASQLASVTGNATDGYVATLTVGIAR
jgi:protocatechuate 3,4-dioxygenase beta subunit